jgi:hypothetical protein
MNDLINRINTLENQRDNGTITMENEVVLIKLIEIAEKLI